MDESIEELFKIEFSHNEYDRYYFGLRYLGNRFLLSKLDKMNFNGDRLLDLGSGRLILSSCLSVKGFKVIAADLPDIFDNHDVKKRSRQHAIGLTGVKLIPGKSQHLPFKNKSFSLVLMTEIFEHLNFSPLYLLKEVRRILKDDGYLILTTPNVNRLENKLKFLFNQSIYADYKRYLNEPVYNYHWREFAKRELLEILITSNYQPVKTYFCNDILINQYSKFLFPKLPKIIRAYFKKWIYNILFFIPGLKKQVIIIASKRR
jgi:ubiquinone/menaquinone biosynthesis C-methylase UbiE